MANDAKRRLDDATHRLQDQPTTAASPGPAPEPNPVHPKRGRRRAPGA